MGWRLATISSPNCTVTAVIKEYFANEPALLQRASPCTMILGALSLVISNSKVVFCLGRLSKFVGLAFFLENRTASAKVRRLWLDKEAPTTLVVVAESDFDRRDRFIAVNFQAVALQIRRILVEVGHCFFELSARDGLHHVGDFIQINSGKPCHVWASFPHRILWCKSTEVGQIDICGIIRYGGGCFNALDKARYSMRIPSVSASFFRIGCFPANFNGWSLCTRRCNWYRKLTQTQHIELLAAQSKENDFEVGGDDIFVNSFSTSLHSNIVQYRSTSSIKFELLQEYRKWKMPLPAFTNLKTYPSLGVDQPSKLET